MRAQAYIHKHMRACTHSHTHKLNRLHREVNDRIILQEKTMKTETETETAAVAVISPTQDRRAGQTLGAFLLTKICWATFWSPNPVRLQGGGEVSIHKYVCPYININTFRPAAAQGSGNKRSQHIRIWKFIRMYKYIYLHIYISLRNNSWFMYTNINA